MIAFAELRFVDEVLVQDVGVLIVLQLVVELPAGPDGGARLEEDFAVVGIGADDAVDVRVQHDVGGDVTDMAQHIGQLLHRFVDVFFEL